MTSLTTNIHNGLEYSNFTATEAEPFEKALKIVDRGIQLAQLITGTVSTPFLTLSSQLKDACTVLESVKIFGSIKMFIVPEKNGHYLLTNPDNSWQKCLDRVSLLAHNAFKFVKGLNKFGFVQLGVMAKNVIGQLPIFTLVMDSFIVASSAFSTWDTFAFGLPKAHGEASEAQAKLDKWQGRLAAIEYLKTGHADEAKKISDRYLKKFEEIDNKITSLTFDQIAAELKIAELQRPLSVEYQTTPELEETKAVLAEANKGLKQAEAAKNALLPYIELINNQEWKGLAAILEEKANRPMRIINQAWTDRKEDDAVSRVDFKIRKWEAMKTNAKINTNKAWISIANAIGKIVVVGMALAFSALNLWVLPSLIAINLVGNTVDAIGWTKFATTKFYRNVTVPNAIRV